MESHESLSPFSINRKYEVIWGNESKNYRSDKRLYPHQKEVINLLSILTCGTRIQLAKIFNPTNMRRAKQNVEELIDDGLIITHLLKDQQTQKEIPFYTLSNREREKRGFNLLDKLSVTSVLKSLLLSQFFIRFREIDINTQVLPFPNPFDGAISIMGNEFRIGIIRGSAQDIVKHFMYNQENMRTILVVEKLNAAEELKSIKNPIRIITDYDLLRSDLSESFYRMGSQGWEIERVSAFKNQTNYTSTKITTNH
jgi:hypothetical protein